MSCLPISADLAVPHSLWSDYPAASVLGGSRPDGPTASAGVCANSPGGFNSLSASELTAQVWSFQAVCGVETAVTISTLRCRADPGRGLTDVLVRAEKREQGEARAASLVLQKAQAQEEITEG